MTRPELVGIVQCSGCILLTSGSYHIGSASVAVMFMRDLRAVLVSSIAFLELAVYRLPYDNVIGPCLHFHQCILIVIPFGNPYSCFS